jgi:uncharacterized FAD-dependent dehydrogenase
VTLRLKDIEVPINQNTDPDLALSDRVAAALEVSTELIRGIHIRKKSLDARRKARIVYHYQVDVDLEDELQVYQRNRERADIAPVDVVADPLAGLELGNIRDNVRHKPLIIGSGPAGTFAALVLAQAGIPAIVIERGEAVEQRFRTINRFRRDGAFTAESNYCFGEGGAGTFSDGKLSCGRNHPLIRYLFQKWVEYGGPKEILYDAHPHIGTDKLMFIAKSMRRSLEDRGIEFMFKRQFLGFETGTTSKYRVHLSGNETLDTDHVILAVGHSARDTYQMLFERGFAMAPKPFAIGARIEHPQEAINKIQFGNCQVLPAAEYKLTAQSGNRGIWTFCMCPGGHLLPTSAQPGHLAINGMSYHARKSGFANAAVVVNVNRDDFYRDHVLDGMHFQEELERRAYEAGGGGYISPAQRLTDFLGGRLSKSNLISTYKPGISSARLDKILPAFVVDSLKVALGEYNKRMRGYIQDDGVVVGVESKTSSPVVMTRSDKFQSVSHPGIFPSGEGAGFAGGIVSAALDGVRVGRSVVEDILS